MKYVFIAVVAIAVIAAGMYFFGGENEQPAARSTEPERTVPTAEVIEDPTLAGVWQSDEDPNFVRTIYENGGYMDTYEGMPDATVNGPWVTFTADTAPAEFTYPTNEDTLYLQLDGDDAPLYFAVEELSADRLVLIYLDRGNVLSFTRIETL